MAAFETIVRPVVFPNIRPAPTRSLPPADDPEQGLCVIRGSGGGVIAANFSVSISGSTHNPKETERRVDTARVYQKNDDGTINRENFVELEVANRITMEEGVGGDLPEFVSAPPGVGDPNAVYRRGTQFSKYYYAPIKEADNIEITKRDTIKKESAEGEAPQL